MITQEERNHVFDRLKGLIANNYVEKQMWQAGTRSDAVNAAREVLKYSGFGGPDIPSVGCDGGGIRVATKDGRKAKFNWGEFADYVLNTQASLF